MKNVGNSAPQKPNPSKKERGSLIERAAQVYDFRSGITDKKDKTDASADIVDVEVEPVTAGNPAVEDVVAEGAASQTIDNGTVEEALDADDEAAAAEPGPLVLYRRPLEVDRNALVELGYIMPDTSPTSLGEEFRIVKRHLLTAAHAHENGRLILVCSSEPDEGKTFCAVNLALSMATERDIEVLLVDADFAKPEILSTLGIEGGRGLMDALMNPDLDVESCIIRTDIGGLSVLPAGRMVNDATEILASDYSRTVFERLLANPSRIVILDSAPALAASSASVLASLAGQTLFIVRADVTGEAEMREALNLLSRCSHIRLLLNGAQLVSQGRRFGAYYGYGG